MSKSPDFNIIDEGTIVLIVPTTDEARAWLVENCQPEPWQWLGRSLGVEARYAEALISGIQDEGFTVA